MAFENIPERVPGPSSLPELDDSLLEEAYAFDSDMNKAYALLRENGVEDRANALITAHGRTMSIAHGIVGCPPFAKNIRSTIEMLDDDEITDVGIRARKLGKWLDRQKDEAPEATPGEAEKK